MDTSSPIKKAKRGVRHPAKSGRTVPVNRANNRLREYRKRAGLTQMQLAAKLSELTGYPVSVPAICRAEKHGRGIGTGSWNALADLFDVDPRVLEGRKEESVVAVAE